MKDPDFLAECQKRKLDIDVRNAAETTKLVETIVSASPQLVERVKKAVGMGS
jgi:hypothetical protein